MALKKKKIGVFDSGIGGFSLLKELVSELSGHSFYYISDEPHSPYGNKSGDFIRERSKALTEELLNEGVDLILVACNTATAEAIDGLRESFEIPFVGIEPFVKAIENFNFESSQVKPVVITTKAMGESERFKKLLSKHDVNQRITPFSSPQLASLIEKAYRGKKEDIIDEVEEELRPLRGRGFTHAILGCTHYPLIGTEISSILQLECISPCKAVAKRVASVLDVGQLKGPTEIRFKSSNEESFREIEPALLSLN